MITVRNIMYTLNNVYRWFQHHLYYRPKFFIQRGKRGYSDYDVCELHYHICTTLASSLKDFKKHGVLPGSYCAIGYDHNAACKEWDNVLDGMIEGFDAGVRVLNDDHWHDCSSKKEALEKYPGCYISPFDENDKTIYIHDEQGEAADREKLRKALVLLSEHIEGLWD